MEFPGQINPPRFGAKDSNRSSAFFVFPFSIWAFSYRSKFEGSVVNSETIDSVISIDGSRESLLTDLNNVTYGIGDFSFSLTSFCKPRGQVVNLIFLDNKKIEILKSLVIPLEKDYSKLVWFNNHAC